MRYVGDVMQSLRRSARRPLGIIESLARQEKDVEEGESFAPGLASSLTRAGSRLTTYANVSLLVCNLFFCREGNGIINHHDVYPIHRRGISPSGQFKATRHVQHVCISAAPRLHGLDMAVGPHVFVVSRPFQRISIIVVII